MEYIEYILYLEKSEHTSICKLPSADLSDKFGKQLFYRNMYCTRLANLNLQYLNLCAEFGLLKI